MTDPGTTVTHLIVIGLLSAGSLRRETFPDVTPSEYRTTDGAILALHDFAWQIHHFEYLRIDAAPELIE